MTYKWDQPPAHIFSMTVDTSSIDVLGHANNCEYLKWMEQAAWSHCSAIQMEFAQWQKLGFAWVAHHTEIDYLAAAFADDELAIGTWISHNDNKLAITRQYQIIRKSDGKTLVRASNRWVCINLDTKKAARMPEAFKQAFACDLEHA